MSRSRRSFRYFSYFMMGRPRPEDSIVLKELKTCAIFDVLEALCPLLEPGEKYPIFRDPAGVEILSRIAVGLADRGYRVGKVKPGVGIEAGLICELSKSCEIAVILGVSGRHDGKVMCDLVAYHSPSLLTRLAGRSRPGLVCIEQFKLFCAAIHDQIIDSLHVASPVWLTETEANQRWSVSSSPPRSI
jgi:hypothetical protein